MTRPEDREQFEAWMGTLPPRIIDQGAPAAGEYENRLWQDAWEVWQAARASLPVALPPLPEPYISEEFPTYTGSQMRAYARAAIEAASRGTGDAEAM